MKRNLSTTVSVTAIAVLFLFNSCNKELEGFHNPLIGGCQVAEYHDAQFDQYLGYKPPYLFRKTFDPSGKIAKEITCGFLDDDLPSYFPGNLLDVIIVQKDWRIFLLKADSGTLITPVDTLFTIYLNWEGRPDSCIGRPGSAPEAGSTAYELEYYYYKDNKVQLIKNNTILYGGEHGLSFQGTDTVHYDKYGNPSSFVTPDYTNTYNYDYTKKGGQKFYTDAFMGIETDFYLLQYLGFFPEINNPPNLRTYAYTSGAGEGGGISNQQFDAQGKLIGFGLQGESYTITWNCTK